MRFLIALAFASLLLAPAATAQSFAPDDVSILLAPPEGPDSPLLAVPESSFSQASAERVAKVVAQFGGVASAGAIDPDVFRARRGQLHVTSLRVDPGAPGLAAGFAPFGRSPQLRLVVQPVSVAGDKVSVADEAIHLVYTYGKRAGTEACVFHADPDLDAFAAVVDDLAALKASLREVGIDTDDAPLGVHPAFATEAGAGRLIAGLDAFLRKHATEDRLDAVSVAGLPKGGPEPWIFLALGRDTATGEARPVPGPAITQTNEVKAFAQALSFARDFQNGEVIPPGLTRNLLPVDCLANMLPLPAQPMPEDGVSTSSLFAPGANTPEAAAKVAAVVADPARAHFFNTDCLSCHTETRREIDASDDTVRASDAIAAAEGIDPAAMPRGPDDSGRAFDKWNVRAFGWYPGFGPVGARAHATVVRRTARETADVVACLNSGTWRDPSLPCPGAAAGPAPERQGWSDEIRERFYHSSQGSVLMPAAYFTALPKADGTGLFAAPENLAGYGLLPTEGDPLGLDPLGLPIGLALNGPGADAAVGLNCAACHTADVIVGEQRLRVDGAPAAFDFDRFLTDLARSVESTIRIGLDGRPTPAFAAFLAQVQATAPDLAEEPVALGFAEAFLEEAASRHPARPSGPGRVDALTQIVNTLAASDLGVPDNLRVPAAPTSYPALWLAPRLEFVQWNLTAADPLGRNIGQALGVFGRTDLKGEHPTFATTADLTTLQAYERWLQALEPPKWPGPIDTTRAEKGRDLFAANCLGCHNAPPFEETKPDKNLTGQTFIKVGAVPFDKAGTDPVYSQALLGRSVETGPLAARLDLPPLAPAGRYFGKVVHATTLSLLAKAGTPPATVLRMRPAGHPDCGEAVGPCPYQPPGGGAALKAGPLIGIWATGPYLHNGSVRTVYELLSPPEERATAFWIGDRTLDTEHLGFADTETPDAFRFDATLPGNRAQGHVFWPQPFSPEERLALIEYLKDPEALPIAR